jgi:hypothetical protein
MKKYIRKADIILFIVLVAVGLAASVALAMRGDSAGDKVIIESGGDLYATYSLAEDQTVIVPAPKQVKMDAPDTEDKYDYYNIVEIKDGMVTVTEASCRNQVCVKHSPVSRSGESIVCLPNRLVVRIDSGSGKNKGSGGETNDNENDGYDDSGEGEGYDTVTS